MFAKGCLAGRIHAGVNGAVCERFLRSLSRLHDKWHRADTEQEGNESRCKCSSTMKENPEEYGNTGHRKADNRHMIDGKMQMSGGKKGLHDTVIVAGSSRAGKREGG
jgi:hypothetical protein